MSESLAWGRRYSLPIRRATPKVLLTIEVNFHSVLDLTDAAVRRRLKLTLAAISGDLWWIEQEEGRESLCQSFGRAAWEAKVEGMRVPSAHDRSGWNLILFPENLRPSSSLKVLGLESCI